MPKPTDRVDHLYGDTSLPHFLHVLSRQIQPAAIPQRKKVLTIPVGTCELRIDCHIRVLSSTPQYRAIEQIDVIGKEDHPMMRALVHGMLPVPPDWVNENTRWSDLVQAAIQRLVIHNDAIGFAILPQRACIQIHANVHDMGMLSQRHYTYGWAWRTPFWTIMRAVTWLVTSNNWMHVWREIEMETVEQQIMDAELEDHAYKEIWQEFRDFKPYWTAAEQLCKKGPQRKQMMRALKAMPAKHGISWRLCEKWIQWYIIAEQLPSELFQTIQVDPRNDSYGSEIQHPIFWEYSRPGARSFTEMVNEWMDESLNNIYGNHGFLSIDREYTFDGRKLHERSRYEDYKRVTEHIDKLTQLTWLTERYLRMRKRPKASPSRDVPLLSLDI